MIVQSKKDELKAAGTDKAVQQAVFGCDWSSLSSTMTIGGNFVAYETFERGSVRTEDPGITVRPDGRIFFNAASSRLLKASSVKTVRILWDRDKCAVALQACPAGDKNAYSIAFPAGSRSPSLTAKSFMRYVGWSASHAQKIAVKWDEKNKILEATLPPRFVGKREKKEMKAEANTGH